MLYWSIRQIVWVTVRLSVGCNGLLLLVLDRLLSDVKSSSKWSGLRGAIWGICFNSIRADWYNYGISAPLWGVFGIMVLKWWTVLSKLLNGKTFLILPLKWLSDAIQENLHAQQHVVWVEFSSPLKYFYYIIPDQNSCVGRASKPSQALLRSLL